MKTLINKAFAVLAMVSILYTSVGTSFAQFDDYNYNASSYDWGTGSSYDYNYGSYNSGSYDYSNWGSGDSSAYNYGGSSYANPSYDYSNWTYQNPSTYDYNYGSYTNPNVDVVDTTYTNPSTTGYDYSNWSYQDPSTYDYNYGSYTNPNVDVVDTTYANPSYDYSNWSYQDPSTYNYNYGSYTNPNIDVVDTTCTNCGGSTYDYSNWTYQNPATYDYNYGSYTNPNVDVVDTTCIGCDTSYVPTYTTPTYTTPTYTTPTYTTPTYTTPTYTTPTYTYPTYTYPTYTYPTYTTPTYTPPIVLPTTPITVCSDGLPPLNGSCVRTTTIPTTTTTVCSDGTTPNPLTGCTHTTTIPVTTITNCTDGLPRNADGTCTRVNTIPTSTITRCSDGQPPVNGSCVRVVTAPTVTYQSCWDGSTIPLGSVCPAQYKTCPNGTSIPVNQTCYYTPSTPYVPPQEIKFNNVITSVATEITNTSARCNGIGLIASGASSIGWFEYGETPNLGRETGKANIGSSPTAPFSNVLASLKPSTTYYCRAVMQNQYGTVKGEVVAFTTKAVAVTYVKPVTTTTTTKVTTTTGYKASYAPKNEVACVDGTTVKLESKTTAQLLQSGQKLITLQIEKTGGELAPGSAVSYKLTFKNLADESLRGVTVKVTVPPEIVLTNASVGKFDPATRILVIDQPVLAPTTEGSVTWSGVVNREVQPGKSIATTGYASYSVPGTDVQDEVTAYAVGSVVPSTGNGTSTTGAKNVIGASTSERGFLPDTLVEWLALIAIIFIIFVLGRSVYTSYTTEKKTVVHH